MQDVSIAMSLSREETFAAWAPARSRWSAWAKPVLFADAVWEVSGQNPTIPDPGLLRHLRDTALVIDLPESDSILLGLALAKAGFQPVPLYNGGDDPAALVDMSRIARYLVSGAEILKGVTLREDAPPAFLMNSERRANSVSVPGRYDNRWCIVPQDMPSADFLKSAGIRKVVLVCDTVRDDLVHVLFRYQEAGLEMRRTHSQDENPVKMEVSKPGSFKSLFYRAAVFAGLRRNSAGGFGAITPDPSSMGGGGM
jgi:hypothetical protein